MAIDAPPDQVFPCLNSFQRAAEWSPWPGLAPEGAGARVTWGPVADMGMNPVGRWMGLMMDRRVGADYERGLANLKALVEGG